MEDGETVRPSWSRSSRPRKTEAFAAGLQNREYQDGRLDFVAEKPELIASRSRPENAVRMERTENGPFHGYLLSEGANDEGVEGYRVQRPNGDELFFPSENVLRVQYPNQLSFIGRVGTWLGNVGRFIVEVPREANTEGRCAIALGGHSIDGVPDDLDGHSPLGFWRRCI